MDNPTVVLVVDDDPDVAKLLEHRLMQEGFFVLVAEKGRDAIQVARTYLPDLILLDTSLPDLSGWKVCKDIRQESNVPIIVLTDRDSSMDRIAGLELGADDCLPKPVNCRDLMVQINAIFRRVVFARSGHDMQIKIGNVRLDAAAYKVYRQNQLLTLRQKEYDLLHALMSRAGQVIRRAELLDKVWGVDWMGDTRTLDVHIRWVREKIEERPSQPRYIQTVRGVGYRFASPGELGVQ